MGTNEALLEPEEAKIHLKRLYILILIVVVLAGVYGIVLLSEKRGAGPAPLFPHFDPASVAGIHIKADGRTTVLQKSDGVFLVLSEDSLPADPAGVDAMLDEVTSFSKKDMVSSNPGNRSVYQVDSTGVRVGMVDTGGDTVAAFIVGKVGPDYQSSYVRRAGSDDVILAPGYLRSMFDRGERTWQDRLIFSLKPDDIAWVGVHRGDETYALSRGPSGEWHISRPESTACQQKQATGLVRVLAMLRCDGFAGKLPLPGSGITGSDTTLSFTTSDGAEHRLTFGSENDKRQVNVTKDESNIVYLLSRPMVNQLVPPLDALVEKEPRPAGGVPGENSK
jgi:hypothetical protein